MGERPQYGVGVDAVVSFAAGFDEQQRAKCTCTQAATLVKQSTRFDRLQQVPGRFSFDENPLGEAHVAAGELGEFGLKAEALKVGGKGRSSLSMVDHDGLPLAVDIAEFNDRLVCSVEHGFDRLRHGALDFSLVFFLEGKQTRLFSMPKLIRTQGRRHSIVPQLLCR